MTQVQIGRVGGKLHSFKLWDVLTGAVREAGIFPELNERPLHKKAAAILVSGVQRKYLEHVLALQAGRYRMGVFLPPYVMPSRAFEDSKEVETTPSDIVAAKLHIGFINPFRRYERSLPGKKHKDFIRETVQRLNASDPGSILVYADDRNAIVDNLYLEPLYGELRNHWSPQIREIFAPGHHVPGTRVKETTGAQYGVLNAIYRYQAITKKLRLQGERFDEAKRMDTVLCIKPLFPEQSGFPEEGIIVNAIGDTVPYRAVTRADLEAAENGRIFTFDDFNLVDFPGLPKGTTLHELKQQDPLHPYFTQVYSPGVAVTAFAASVGVHQRRKDKSRVFLGPPYAAAAKQKGPRTVVSSALLMTAPPERKDVKRMLCLPPGMKLAKNYSPFCDLKQLEQRFSGQAFVVQDPDQFPVPLNHGLRDKKGGIISADDIRLLRQLETDLVYAYLITMSTQSGAPNHFARPHLVEKSYFIKEGGGKWHGDMANLGIANDAQDEAYRLFEGPEELADGFKEWDRMHYQHHAPDPVNNFVKEDWIKNCLNVEDLGLVVSGYGSASTYIDAAYKDATRLFYEVSKLHNVMTIDGGGTHSVMLGMKEGALKAYREGYPILNLGIRSETDVSPIEGDIEKWIKENGYTPAQGKDARHIHFANGHMHILKLSRLLQRQHPIAALSHISTFFPGGKGTIVEALITMYHNARVAILGEGFFPGYSSNTRQVPMLFSNHQFEYLGKRRGIFDVFLSAYHQHFVRLNMHEFTGENRLDDMLDFIIEYANEEGLNPAK